MSILAFFAVLLTLVLVHEFGHFIVAKKFGIRVDEFGFGFPPRLFGWKYGETEYTINALPIGGFVRIYGEQESNVSADDPDRPRSFAAKPPYVQAAVLAAGVVANLFLAWILFVAVLLIGVPFTDVKDVPFSTQLENMRLTVVNIAPDAPAQQAGLRVGDAIRAVKAGDDTLIPDTAIPIDQFIGTFQRFVASHADMGVTVTYERGGEMHTAGPIKPIETENRDVPYIIGIAMDYVGTLRLPLHQALIEGAVQTYRYTRDTVYGLVDFLTDAVRGRADYSTVAGPVGIAGIIGDAVEMGVVQVLMITAIISINLAVINLLPFPALDGGRLLFLLIEVIKGSPIRQSVAQTVNFIGFALLLFLMALVTYWDISKMLVGS